MPAPAGARPTSPTVTGNGSRSTATSACRPCSRRRHRTPDALVVQRLLAGPGEAEVVVSLVAGPDRETTEQTINSFLNCCLDAPLWVGRFLVVDAGLSAPDRALLRERYGFLEFVDCSPGDGPAAQLAQLRAQIQGRFWLHLGQGWRFFAPENFITRLIAVLESEPQVFQVGINFADAVKLTGVCAAEAAVRRAPDAGRYVLTDAVASGPAMFDTARLDRAGGIEGSDPDPIAELGRRAVAVGLQTASLDEVLCIAAVPPVPQPKAPARTAKKTAAPPAPQPKTPARTAKKTAAPPAPQLTQNPGTGREEDRSPTRPATQNPGTGRQEDRSPTHRNNPKPRHGRQEDRSPTHAATQNPGTGRQEDRSPTHPATQNPDTDRQENRSPTHRRNPKPRHGPPRRPQPHPRTATQNPGTGRQEGTSAENTSSVTGVRDDVRYPGRDPQQPRCSVRFAGYRTARPCMR